MLGEISEQRTAGIVGNAEKWRVREEAVRRHSVANLPASVNLPLVFPERFLARRKDNFG